MAVPHAGYATFYAALLHAGYATRDASPTYAGYVAPNADLPHSGHTDFYGAPPAWAQTWAPSSPTEWVFDSGATAHLSKDAGILHSLSPHPVYRHVTIGDGSSVPVSSSGHVSLPSFLSNRPLHLRDVLVTPCIIKNLVSVRQFTTDNNCSIYFDPFGFSVRDLFSRHELLRCNSKGELYSFQHPAPRALTTTTTPHDIWHRRLGHPGHDAYRRLSQHISLPSHKQVSHSTLCHACQLGCHVRLPFSSSTTRTTRPFELIHCDLWTSPVLSTSGFKYFLVILDDFTHFLWTIPLRLKSDTYAALASFCVFAYTQFNLPLASIQCDNGREFNNAKLHSLAAAHGIHIRFSCPYTSQQNGKAERVIRTINDIVRPLLFQASLPPCF
jgi:histone deacetylase 1/2